MNKQSSSYKQIVKTTSVFGGVQIVNIIIGIIRNKAIALLLGKAGIGIIGTYQNIIDLIRAISTLGIDTVGIKEIASASGDKEKQGEKISVFKWWIILTAFIGSFICLVFCYPISFWIGGETYVLPVALLSVCIFFTSLAMGQSFIMQGLRKIHLMVKSSLLGNIGGLLVALPLYYFFGFKGIVPAFIASSIILLFFTNRYIKKTDYKKIKIQHPEAFRKGLLVLKLGFFIVSVTIIDYSSMFFIRLFLGNKLDWASVGIFNASWTITMVYISLILRAMGTDFFPRLCSIAENSFKIRRLVNQQTYIAVVLATPLVVGALIFSEFILSFLYSQEFSVGASLLQWQIAGTFFKILSWPIAFILLAKGKGLRYLLSEVIYFAIYVGFSYFLFPVFGLNAVGIAYLAAYIIYLVIIFIYAVEICRFRWNRQNLKVMAVSFGFILLAIGCIIYFPGYLIFLGILLTILSTLFAIFMLNKVFYLSGIIEEIKNKIFNRK